jgi:hydrogenase/urease accessory protein HupE
MKGIRMKRTALLATAVFASTAPAFADPGHGMAASFFHLLTEPDHLAIIAFLAVAGWYSFRRLLSRA